MEELTDLMDMNSDYLRQQSMAAYEENITTESPDPPHKKLYYSLGGALIIIIIIIFLICCCCRRKKKKNIVEKAKHRVHQPPVLAYENRQIQQLDVTELEKAPEKDNSPVDESQRNFSESDNHASESKDMNNIIVQPQIHTIQKDNDRLSNHRENINNQNQKHIDNVHLARNANEVISIESRDSERQNSDSPIIGSSDQQIMPVVTHNRPQDHHSMREQAYYDERVTRDDLHGDNRHQVGQKEYHHRPYNKQSDYGYEDRKEPLRRVASDTRHNPTPKREEDFRRSYAGSDKQTTARHDYNPRYDDRSPPIPEKEVYDPNASRDSRYREVHSREVRRELNERIAGSFNRKYNDDPTTVPEPDYGTTKPEVRRPKPFTYEPPKHKMPPQVPVFKPRDFKGPYGQADLDEEYNPYT